MDTRHLRAFVVLSEELHYTRAADRLNMAQSALSMQMRSLERQVGVRLLRRSGRNTVLTEAGTVFLEQARKSVKHAALGVTLARRADSGEIGELSIGYNHPAEFQVFRKIVPAFKKRWPDVHLAFHSLKISQHLDGLRRDELDLVFDWLPVPTEEFDVLELTQAPLAALLPLSHPLAARPSISIKDLSHEPLILFPRVEYPYAFYEIEQLFLSEGAAMNVVYELETALSVINFVAMGIGCSLLPDYWRRIRDNDVVYRDIRPPNIVKTLGMIKKKGRTGLPDIFYRFTAENISTDRGLPTAVIGTGAYGPGHKVLRRKKIR